MSKKISRSLFAILISLISVPSFAAEVDTTFANALQGVFDFKAPDAVLQVTLTLPAGLGPFPAVVIMHGGAGISPQDRQLADALTQRGFAAAIIDSFTGRGFKPDSGTGAGASLRPTVRVADAYAALALFATHPQIDKNRISLFGRSHGGASTMIAATSWAKSTLGQSGVGFKAFLAVYPVCSVSYPEFHQISAPLRLHLAEKDDLTPAKQCQATVASMRAHGQDVQATVYSDAHHSFDSDFPVRYVGTWITYGDCNFKLSSVDATLPMNEVRQCARRGASLGANSAAAALFLDNVIKELTDFLR